MADFKEIQIGADGQVYQVKDETARNNAGGYTPPAGGIPKTDLASSVQQTLDDVANKVDKETGKGLSTNDYTTEDKTKLAGLPTNPVQSISVNGQTQQKDTNGNVNVVVPTVVLDDAPTAGSPNGVKSGGVKTALAAKANVTDVPTITQMSEAIDEAYNDAVVQVLDGETGVLDTLSSDSQTDALSANMGKRLKAAILTLYYSLNNFCFANTRPQLILDGSTTVDYNVTYVQQPNISYGVNAPSSVELGNRLEITVETTSNLYFIDDDNVIVTMNGQIITNAWNPTTRKVIIPAVIGNVLINVQAMSYVDADGAGNKLAFMLDCKNGLTIENGVPTTWEDVIGNIEFGLTNVTIGSDGSLVFNGTDAKGIAATAGLPIGYNDATIEAVIDMSGETLDTSARYTILGNTLDGCAGAGYGTSGSGLAYIACSTNYGDIGLVDGRRDTAFFFDKTKKSFSSSRADVVIDGVEQLNPRRRPQDGSSQDWWDVNDFTAGKSLVFGVGYMQLASSERFFKGKIMAIRVYRTRLTVPEMIHNHEIDKIRFNLQ